MNQKRVVQMAIFRKIKLHLLRVVKQMAKGAVRFDPEKSKKRDSCFLFQTATYILDFVRIFDTVSANQIGQIAHRQLPLRIGTYLALTSLSKKYKYTNVLFALTNTVDGEGNVWFFFGEKGCSLFDEGVCLTLRGLEGNVVQGLLQKGVR